MADITDPRVDTYARRVGWFNKPIFNNELADGAVLEKVLGAQLPWRGERLHTRGRGGRYI